MHKNRPLIRNACTNAVGPFRLLRPHSPKPDAPFLELFGPGLITAEMRPGPKSSRNGASGLGECGRSKRKGPTALVHALRINGRFLCIAASTFAAGTHS